MALCAKCSQAAPFHGDSWCIGCSAHEALGAELRLDWGASGSRSLAHDLVVSSLRQVRALRRFGLSSSGGASKGASALCGADLRAPSASQKRKEIPEPPPAPRVPVKEEAAEESESEESETEEDEKAPAASAKVKPEGEEKTRLRSAPAHRREELPRGSGENAERRKSRKRHRSAEDERSEPEEDRRKSERHREHRDSRREREKERKRFRPGHRGGSRHQKWHKAQSEPYRKFHSKLPESFWDEPRDRF